MKCSIYLNRRVFVMCWVFEHLVSLWHFFFWINADIEKYEELLHWLLPINAQWTLLPRSMEEPCLLKDVSGLFLVLYFLWEFLRSAASNYGLHCLWVWYNVDITGCMIAGLFS